MLQPFLSAQALLFFFITNVLGWLLWRACRKSSWVLFLVIAWLIFQGFLGLNGFYTNSSSVPPRFGMMIVPPTVIILFVFLFSKTRRMLNQLDAGLLTLLQVIRIPVEIGLLLLFFDHQVPKLMTFEGRNIDIFSGITAPLIWYFGYVKQSLSKPVIVTWNILCLGLVLNVVIHGILSAPTAFQTLSFDQPNVAVMYFPFNWLPSFIVPVVIFSHLVCIKQLLVKPDVP